MSAEVGGDRVGQLLRSWRLRRRLSQQRLSDLTSVSARHISRIENGLASPSAAMILRLADRLDVPASRRDALLTAGGFAPRRLRRQPGDAVRASVIDGLRALVAAHMPYPAVLLDEHWNVVAANPAAEALLAGGADRPSAAPVNVVRSCLDADGLAGRIVDLPGFAARLHGQVRGRAELTGDPRLQALADEVAGVLAGLGRPEVELPGDDPVTSLELEVDGRRLRYLSLSARLNIADDATLAGLHLETFLPADDATARHHLDPRRPHGAEANLER